MNLQAILEGLNTVVGENGLSFRWSNKELKL